MNDPGRSYAYPRSVRVRINQATLADYERAAEFLNAGNFEIACLQHEFGIFGGEAGGHVLALLSRLTMPIVTTLHTVLSEPTPMQREVLSRVVELSASVIVMAEKGRELLRSEYRAPGGKIDVIPHGIPDYPFVEPEFTKAKLGFEGKRVVLTFGLLSPNKGIEFMIDAMPGILRREPDAVYVVLGATHPNLIREEGEAYREQLIARAKDLRVDSHVIFLNQFVDQATLLEFISMCDVYVTPYLNESQMTFRHIGVQLRVGKSRRLDAVLARARAAQGRTGSPGAVCRSCCPWHAGCRPAHRSCSPKCHAGARLCKQPLDDLGANRGTLLGYLR